MRCNFVESPNDLRRRLPDSHGFRRSVLQQPTGKSDPEIQLNASVPQPSRQIYLPNGRFSICDPGRPRCGGRSLVQDGQRVNYETTFAAAAPVRRRARGMSPDGHP